jgi:hypothetical protein
MLSAKGKAIEAKVVEQLKDAQEKTFGWTNKELLMYMFEGRRNRFREDNKDAYKWEEALSKILSRYSSKPSISSMSFHRRTFALSMFAFNIAQDELDYSKEAENRVAEKLDYIATEVLDLARN